MRRPEYVSLLLIHVAVVFVVRVRVRKGSLGLKIARQDLHRVANVEALQVLGILVDIVQCLDLKVIIYN